MISEIPDRYKRALAVIRDATDSDIRELSRSLHEGEQPANLQALKARVTTHMRGRVLAQELEPVLDALYTVCLQRARLGGAAALDMAKDVRTALEETEGPQNTEDTSDNTAWERFERRLANLTDAPALLVLSQAADLVRAQSKPLVGVPRVLSDFKTLFGSDYAAGPVAAVVAHTLKLQYRENGEYRDIYVSIDDSDIDALQNALDRAQARGDSMRAMLSTQGIPCIVPE